MALNPGDRIAHYEIASMLGAGGMGEVYRARDTRLGRDVAIKVLPGEVASDPQRLARLEREAAALAALNHPNIAHVYGLEQGPPGKADRALVMELVEGEDLSQRIARAPLSVNDALRLALQIADALDAAHTSGIVHRDLKPANIRLKADGSIRLLDFGLARFADTSPTESGYGVTAEALTTPPLTSDTVIVGTVAYMSPEQTKGAPADKLCDIWAFGCVLYELLARQRAFAGSTPAEMIARILEREPDWNALPPATPRELVSLVRKCLKKPRTARLRDIADARLDLEEAMHPPAADAEARARGAAAHARREHVRLGITAAVIGLAAIAAVRFWPTSAPVSDGLMYVDITPPPGLTLGVLTVPLAAVSPDGREVAFMAGSDASPEAIWVRSIDQPEPRRLVQTESAFALFWSPDGQSIGFASNQRLLRTDLHGGTPQLIARVTDLEGAQWGANGTILFGSSAGGIARVAASGGEPAVVTTPTAEERSHTWPVWLPDGKRFLYRAANGTVSVASIDGGPPRALTTSDAKAVFVPPDILLFVRGEDVMAQRFDPERAELMGSAVRIRDQVRVANRGRASFFASPQGFLYRRRSPAVQVGLQFTSADGRQTRTFPLGQVRGFAVSLDGSSIAVHAHETNTPSGELWRVDVTRGGISRIGTGTMHEDWPVWSPDGQRLAIASNGLAVITVGAAPVRDQVVKRPADVVPTDWSRDGQWIIYTATVSEEKGADIFAVRLSGDRTPRPIVETVHEERNGVLSPNGRWLAYTSNESGRPEVYLQPFPPDGRKVSVSVDGATAAQWGTNTQLYYWADDGRVMRTTLRDTGTTLEPQNAEFVFKPSAASANLTVETWRVPYAVLPDHRGVISLTAPSTSLEPPLTLIRNWQAPVPQ